MPAHLGAMHAWCLSDLPPPSYVCTSSAGGIVGAVTAQWHEPAFREIGELMINLRKRDFVGINPKIRNHGILTILATLGMLTPTQKINNAAFRMLATMGVTGLALWAQKEFITNILFHSESFLVYDNLEKLLMRKLDFKRIFESSIKLELLAVNINKAGWFLDDILKDPPLYIKGWKNEGWVSATNFRPEDVNFDEQARNIRLVKAIVNGARIWSIFNAGRTDAGDFVVDTAALSNVPFHAAINEGFDGVALFYYNRSGEAPTARHFESLLQVTFRANDILVSENTRKTVLGYLRVNNDLEQLAKQKESLERLGGLLDRPDLGEEVKLEINHFIESQKEYFRKLSYTHKKRIKFMIVRSDSLPSINFAKFTGDMMMETINIGAKSFMNARPDLEKLYNGTM